MDYEQYERRVLSNKTFESQNSGNRYSRVMSSSATLSAYREIR